MVMVAAFMAGSLAAPSFIERYGLTAANRVGVIMLAVTTVGLLLVFTAQLPQTAQWYVAVLLPSQIGLGLRFGGSMTEAIPVPPLRRKKGQALCCSRRCDGQGPRQSLKPGTSIYLIAADCPPTG